MQRPRTGPVRRQLRKQNGCASTSAGRAPGRSRTRPHNSRWRRRPVCRDAAPSPGSARERPARPECPRLPHHPAPWPTAGKQQHGCLPRREPVLRAQARTSSFFDERKNKAYFCFRTKLGSFYWLEQHGAEGHLLGPAPGGSVTLKQCFLSFKQTIAC